MTAKVAVVWRLAALAKVTAPAPSSTDHVVVMAGGCGRPSSVTVPSSSTEEPMVTVLTAVCAFTTGAPGLALTVTATVSLTVRAPSDTRWRNT